MTRDQHLHAAIRADRSPTLEERAIQRLTAELEMLKARMAQDQRDVEWDRRERQRLNDSLRVQGKALADTKRELRAANERVVNLVAAIAPCGNECSHHRCAMARRYADPGTPTGATLEVLRSEGKL